MSNLTKAINRGLTVMFEGYVRGMEQCDPHSLADWQDVKFALKHCGSLIPNALVAKWCSVSHGTASKWRNGQTTPDVDARRHLYECVLGKFREKLEAHQAPAHC